MPEAEDKVFEQKDTSATAGQIYTCAPMLLRLGGEFHQGTFIENTMEFGCGRVAETRNRFMFLHLKLQ